MAQPAGLREWQSIEGGQVPVSAIAQRQERDVADVNAVRCRGGEVAFDQVRIFFPDASGAVVRTRRRKRSPSSPCSRITRATRLWFTRPSSPGASPSLRSAVTLGT